MSKVCDEGGSVLLMEFFEDLDLDLGLDLEADLALE